MTVDPARLDARHALLVADGDVPDRAALDRAWPGWDDGVDLVVAADGGAVRASGLGMEPAVIVGDGDSLGAHRLEEYRARGVEILLAPPDKDESDTELALLAALDRGAARVTVLGAFGGRRLDHALANLALLAHTGLAGHPAVLLDGSARATLVRARAAGVDPVTAELVGRRGDLVSLLPFGGPAAGVTTDGLRYPLRDETLLLGPARGLSNVRDREVARVTVRAGLLLVVEHPVWVAADPEAILQR